MKFFGKVEDSGTFVIWLGAALCVDIRLEVERSLKCADKRTAAVVVVIILIIMMFSGASKSIVWKWMQEAYYGLKYRRHVGALHPSRIFIIVALLVSQFESGDECGVIFWPLGFLNQSLVRRVSLISGIRELNRVTRNNCDLNASIGCWLPY